MMHFASTLKIGLVVAMVGSALGAADPAHAGTCPVSQGDLKRALVKAAGQDSTGLNNEYWGVVVDREGVVCAVAYSGGSIDAQWLLSRQIAAAKAFTANGLSLDGKPVSSGALYSFVLPIVPQGNPSSQVAPSVNPLYGLNGGNVQNAEAAYKGNYAKFGSASDPMVGARVGGTITFGGGLGLYQGTKAVGGLGLSGDTACADHSTAWRTRINLGLVPTADGFALDRITLSPTAHPNCPNDTGTQGTT